jgi:hypothetical protein
MATVESYFESLGRQTAKPFLDEQNLYTETEPDLTKPVNDNITKQQEDTSQFFRDNIAMYKELIKVRDNRLKSIFQITKSGAPLVAAYAEHRDRLKRLDILESEKSRIKFRTEGINFNELTNKNLVELNKEIGRAKKEIEKNGIYITQNADGEEVRITTSKELNSYALMIAGLTTSNGRDTARNAAKYFPKFLEIAMKDMPHENGRYFHDLTLDEQVEWWRSLKAYYIGMWQKKDDRFSDGLVVNHLFDAFDKAEKNFYSNIFQTDNEATEKVLSDGNYAEAVGIINTQSANIQKENSYVATEGKVIDEFWGENGYYNRRLGFWLEYHDGNKQKAFESLDNELKAIFRKGIESGELLPDVLDDLFTEWAFPNKDGSGLTTFQGLNTTRSKNLIAFIDGLLDEKTQTLNLTTLQNKLTTYEDNLKKNIFMTQDQFNEYITYSGSHPEMYKKAETIFLAGQQGGMENAKEFGTVDALLKDEILNYVNDNKELFGISKKLKDTDRLVIATVSGITPAINRAYFEYYEGFLTQYENVEDAKKKALEAVTIDIQNGKFKSPLTALADENYEIKDVQKLGKTFEDMIASDNKGWVSANLAHEGEMPHLLIGREALTNGGPLPAIYRQLSKLYPDLSAENLLYERLVATGLIKPNDPKFRMYALRLIPETNIQDSRLLTHFPTMTKALQFMSLNAEQWAEQTEKLHDKDSLKHFDGYGAFKMENGTYSEDIDLRTMSIQDLGQLLIGNENAKFGIYGIKGQDLSLTLQYLVDNQLITGDEVFDDRFQLKLLVTKMKLNQNGQLAYTGDASYLNLSKISDEDEAEFNRLIGKQGENIPMFDRLEFLLPYLIRYKANTEL